MVRVLLWLVGIALVAGALLLGALRVPSVQDRIVERAIASGMAERRAELFEDDALRVLVCGSGSPLPHPSRAGPCIAVFAGGRFWVVDTGPRSWNNLAGWRVDGSRLAGVLLSHFHSDHLGGLGEFNLGSWAAGRPAPLAVHGPPGVERVVGGFNEAFALDNGYRIAHHGADFLTPESAGLRALRFEVAEDGSPTEIVNEGGLRITAFAVDHEPVRPAVGYRFDWRGRSVVVSGDTTRDERLIAAARGADVLLHEALADHLIARIGAAAGAAGRARVAKIMADIPDYHTSPVAAAEVANEAEVELLVLYHLVPPPPARLMESVFLRGVAEVRPAGVALADDGLLIELPRDSDEIRVGAID